MPVYLALWREAHNPPLSQEELGQRLRPKVDKGTVSRWENARPGILNSGVIAAYAEALGRHAIDMYRKPDDGPSLDAMAADLEPELRTRAIGVIAALQGRRGG
jgi:hypothetical protein